jgi:hypothetical protein
LDRAIATGGGVTTPAALAEPAAPALLTTVLRAAAGRGKDVGLINIAYNLPVVVAPLAAGVVLGLLNSYPALFALAGVTMIAAAWTVSRVRSVP